MRTFMENGILFYMMVGVGFLGGISRVVLLILYARFMKDVENIGMAKTGLIKQIKLKFENCYRLNYGVKNVNVFVDKYLYKYKMAGISLHRIEQILGQSMLMTLLLGSGGAVASFFYGYEVEMVVKYFAVGVFIVIFLAIIDGITDGEYLHEVLLISLQDYLENSLVNRLDQGTGISRDTEAEIAYMKKSLEQIAVGSMSHNKAEKKLQIENETPSVQEGEDSEAETIISEVLKEFLS